MEQTTHPTQWVNWLAESDHCYILEPILAASPDWVTPETADKLWTLIGHKLYLPTNTKTQRPEHQATIQRITNNLTGPKIREIAATLPATQLLELLENDHIWNHVNDETKNTLIHHPNDTVRLMVAAHPQFTPQQRFEALTSTETALNAPKITKNGRQPADGDYLNFGSWNLGELTRNQTHRLLTSPIGHVASAAWRELHPPNRPDPQDLTYTQVAELITDYHRNVTEWAEQAPTSGTELKYVREHGQEQLQAYLRAGNFVASDNLPFPDNWLNTTDHTFQQIAALALQLGENRAALNKLRIEASGYYPNQHLSRIWQITRFRVYANTYPHLLHEPEVWENLIQIAGRTHNFPTQPVKWGPVLTLYKPGWTATDVTDTLQKVWKQHLQHPEKGGWYGTRDDMFVSGCHLLQDIITEPNMENENLGVLVQKLFRELFPTLNGLTYGSKVTRTLKTSSGQTWYVRALAAHYPATTLLKDAPQGVIQYLTDMWPQVPADRFLTLAFQDHTDPAADSLTIPQICGMLT